MTVLEYKEHIKTPCEPHKRSQPLPKYRPPIFKDKAPCKKPTQKPKPEPVVVEVPPTKEPWWSDQNPLDHYRVWQEKLLGKLYSQMTVEEAREAYAHRTSMEALWNQVRSK